MLRQRSVSGRFADALSPRHVKRAAAARTAPCRLPPRCRSALLDAAATLTASIARLHFIYADFHYAFDTPDRYADTRTLLPLALLPLQAAFTPAWPDTAAG
jgi:hypothetical protein